MSINFKFENMNTIFLLKDQCGNIVKESREIPSGFYHMEFLDKDIFYDKESKTIWNKSTSIVLYNNNVYFQEEYIDITHFWNENRKLLNETKIDGLTKIYNVKAVECKREEIINNGYNCILGMCDINHFKNINDLYGHFVGNQCLIRLAHIFSEFIKEPNMAARVGGDEFLFIFLTDDINFVKNIINIIEENIKLLGEFLNIDLSVSIGISAFKKGDSWDQKIVEADGNSYHNKKMMKKINYN